MCTCVCASTISTINKDTQRKISKKQFVFKI